ncbi:MAG: acyl-CoA thioesterase [Acidobacteriota bacterium]|nr:acyl-CoA thioesterase [Acidobacteriota bacterium]
MPPPDELSPFAVQVKIPVLWSDEDTFGHVNNIAYLRWCEEGRIGYLRRIGLLPGIPPQGIGPIVASLTCHYRTPLNYPDSVVVGTRVVRIGRSSFRMDHRIFSLTARLIAAEAETTLVTIDYGTGKPVPVPDPVREAISRLDPGCDRPETGRHG